MPGDILEEIPLDLTNYFCNNILKRDWPNSIHVYNFIRSMTEWQRRHADVLVSLLCVDRNIEDGTFIGILFSELGGCTVLAYTQEESCERLARGLQETRRIKWSKAVMFEAVLQKHTAVVHEVVQAKGFETSVYSQSNILYMPSEEAKKLTPKCSLGVYVAPLKQCHVPYIHSVWAHNDVYTLRELENTVRHNGGFGVFSASDHQLLSWAMHTHYGGVGVLQTRADHGGKGYARVVVNSISQALAKMGISPHVLYLWLWGSRDKYEGEENIYNEPPQRMLPVLIYLWEMCDPETSTKDKRTPTMSLLRECCQCLYSYL